MHKRLLQLVCLCGVLTSWLGVAPSPAADAVEKPPRVHVIPVKGEIGSAVLYVIRRGIKEAIAENADAIVLEVNTPGGALPPTLEIMEAIAKFPRTTIAYVNDEAMSAGAFIAATTHEIWFAPSAIMGAAAPVSAGGQDVDTTMKQKVVSYLRARVRAVSEGKGYRGEVVSAMIDADREFKIGDDVIKPKGELLSLTASEAAKTYGEPARALLSSGTARSVGDLLAQRFPKGAPSVTTLQMTWSESLAAWLNQITPILMGLGMLALFIEFKTPGFGFFGIAGITLLAVVFLSSYVAGLSGHEPLLCFAIGVILVVLELFFLPGTVILALSGVVLMLGSLVWAMADLWPNEPLSVAWSADVFVRPLVNLGLGGLITIVLALLLARFLPQTSLLHQLAIDTGVSGSAQAAGADADLAAQLEELIGRTGVTPTGMYPSGQVEIDQRRFEARLEVGFAPAGSKIRVIRRSDFSLVVEVIA